MKKQGFTLIELIIVIAIIAVIISVVFVALDPVKRLNASRNTRRRLDVTAIASAIGMRLTSGNPIENIDDDASSWQMIGVGNNCGINNCEAGTDGILSSYAASFDGLGQLRIGGSVPFALQPTTPFSVAVWANVIPGTNPLVSLHDDEEDGIDLLLMPDQSVRFMIRTTAGELIVDAPAATSDGAFHHIAATYDGTMSDMQDRTTLFVDGEIIESTTTVNGSLAALGTVGAFALGTGGDPQIYIDGMLDDVRIYQSVLSENQVRGLALGKNLTSGLVGHWDFESMTTPWTDLIADITLSPSGSVEQTDDTPEILNGQGNLFVLSTCVDLEEELVGSGRLGRIPFDPAAEADDARTFYVVNKSGGTYSVRACLAEPEGLGGQGASPLIDASR